MTIIAVAPNGARKTKEDHHSLPITIDEIAREAKACYDAGAGMIHLHVRDELGHHSLSLDLYQQAIDAINAETDHQMLIQATTEAVGKYDPDEQFGMIHALKPDSVSIAIREIKKLDDLDIFENFDLMREHNIRPQLILYNHIDLKKYEYWLSEGILPGEAYPVLLVLGKSHAQGAFELKDLQQKIDVTASNIMICAFGEEEFAAGKLAVDHDWHVRLGFENNQLLENGETAESNADIIAQMTDYIHQQNKEAITDAETLKTMLTPKW